MVRITLDARTTGVTMHIEGRLVGHFAEEARHLVLHRTLSPEFYVDVSEITFVDSEGEDTLQWLRGVGATFIADRSYSLHLCERLGLPLVGQDPPPRPVERKGTFPVRELPELSEKSGD